MLTAPEPGSPPRPESVPVVRPFTVQDTIQLATVSASRRKADDTSMIVNVDALSERTDPELVVNGAAGDTDPPGAKSEAKSASGSSATSAAAGRGTAEPASSGKADDTPAGDSAAAASADASAAGEKSEQPSSDAAGEAAAKTDGDAKTTAAAADGAEGKKEDGDSKPATDAEKKAAEEKEKNKANRNLWVSGLSSMTRATDLKTAFSKFGKVIGAKIVTNARTPGARCYGYITMATTDDATKCIGNLHKTELHGRIINVERAKSDSSVPDRRADDRHRDHRRTDYRRRAEDTRRRDERPRRDASADAKPAGDGADAPAAEGEAAAGEGGDAAAKEGNAPGRANDRPNDRPASRRRDNDVGRRPPPRDQRGDNRRPQRGVLTFQQIKEERERQRRREIEREEREAERRRRDEIARAREQDRRNREEAMKLERERERLRIERERIERDKAELLRLERERQRAEREKLEREREELRRAAMRIQDAKRNIKRPAEEPAAYPERKRPAPAPAPVAASRTSSHYDDRRYATSRDSGRAPAGGARDYGRAEDRRVSERSERYEAAPRREYDRRDYREPARSSRDLYDSKGTGSSRQYGDSRSGGSWHTASSSHGLGNGQAAPQRDTWGAAMDRKTDSSQQWGRAGGSSETGSRSTSRWGSSSALSRQPTASSLSAVGGFMSSSLNPSLGVSSLMQPAVFGSAPDRFDAYKMHGSLPRRY
ncbi:Scaffold attachment factor B1 [Amphibalanus amphitrite]|uniref:Scaffold attachment factor B1 n=1 Tax=Amphibalanus amphitrite TaxID=1232801 RepID=A0A6A4X122_AMPAM|nr:Scaffold attachment factor B1 [Amphibalanus amphitrite]